jgi:phenylalanyl-tRNA synthetase beta chain
MHISVSWLNRCLQPATLTADEAEHALMSLGFPSESRTELPSGDTCLDVEVTSNRGDVLCHAGMASEIAAASGRVVRLPEVAEATRDGEPASNVIAVDNADHVACPLFTARVIRGVKVGPSPQWLREALESCGQRSISNVVDVSNFIAMELGNPCHVFDLAKLEGGRLVVRTARAGEKLTTLDGKARTLAGDEVVVADASKAQSLAGVIGGADSQVTESTVDVVLEMATWDPVAVRRASRRHAVRTEASHRFERVVDARTIAAAAERAAAMIVQVAGGRLCDGSVDVGAPLDAPRVVSLRATRCNAVLGSAMSREEMATILRRLGIGVSLDGQGTLLCTIPASRRDLTREVDLVEEVARVRGLDAIEVRTSIAVAVKPPQASESARRELGAALTGMGFTETVTFSFVTREAAGAFLPEGMRLVEVSEERRKAEPACRPSVIPGLLACRRANQHGGVRVAGGVRLFEIASTFAQDATGAASERTCLALLVDVPVTGKNASVEDRQTGLRLLRGAMESIVRALAGAGATLSLKDASPRCAGLDASGFASVALDGREIGMAGFASASQMAAYELAAPVAVAELDLSALLAAYPPRAIISLPPEFPGIERDVSFIVDEQVTWERIRDHVESSRSPMLERASFVGTFRGRQIGAGKKSVTVRLSYREPSRTLRHEEIDGPVQQLIESMKAGLGATLRT